MQVWFKMKAVIAILIAVALLGLNAWLFAANKKTPVPEGCENLTPNCGSCGITDCGSRIKPYQKEEK